MTSSMSSGEGGGREAASIQGPHIVGWTIDPDLVWHDDKWCTRWHIFIQMPSGEVGEVELYHRFPA